MVDRRFLVCAIECDEFSDRLRLTLRSKSTYDRYLSACRIENGAASPGTYDTYAPFLQVTQDDIHHCSHQCVVESVVLGEGRNAEILEYRREGEIDHRVGRRIAIFALVVELGDLDPTVGQLDPDVGQDVLVQHGDVEIDVIPNQRTSADEMKQPR